MYNMQNFGDAVQGKHFQIRRMEEVEKCAFSTDNWP